MKKLAGILAVCCLMLCCTTAKGQILNVLENQSVMTMDLKNQLNYLHWDAEYWWYAADANGWDDIKDKAQQILDTIGYELDGPSQDENGEWEGANLGVMKAISHIQAAAAIIASDEDAIVDMQDEIFEEIVEATGAIKPSIEATARSQVLEEELYRLTEEIEDDYDEY